MEQRSPTMLPNIHSWRMDPFLETELEETEITEDELMQPPQAVSSLLSKLTRGKSKKEAGYHPNQDSNVYTIRKTEYNQIRREIDKLIILQHKWRGSHRSNGRDYNKLHDDFVKLQEKNDRYVETIQTLQAELSRFKSDSIELVDSHKSISSDARSQKSSAMSDSCTTPHQNPKPLIPKPPKQSESDKKQRSFGRHTPELAPLYLEFDEIPLKGSQVASPTKLMSSESVHQYMSDHPTFLEASLKPMQTGTKIERAKPQTAASSAEEFFYFLRDVMDKCPTTTKLGIVHAIEHQNTRIGNVFRIISELNIANGVRCILQQLTDGLMSVVGGCFAIVYLVDSSRNQLYISGNRYVKDSEGTILLDETAVGNDSSVSMAYRVESERGIAGYVAKNGKLLHVPKVSTSKQFDHDIDLLPKSDVDHSILSVGVYQSDSKNVVAILQVYRNIKQPRFTRQDEIILQLLSFCLRPVLSLVEFTTESADDLSEGSPHPSLSIQQTLSAESPVPSEAVQGNLSSSNQGNTRKADSETIVSFCDDVKQSTLAESVDILLQRSTSNQTLYLSPRSMTVKRVSSTLVEELLKKRATFSASNLSDVPGFDGVKEEVKIKAPLSAMYVPIYIRNDDGVEDICICRLINKRKSLVSGDESTEKADKFSASDENSIRSLWRKYSSSLPVICSRLIRQNTLTNTQEEGDNSFDIPDPFLFSESIQKIIEELDSEQLSLAIIKEIPKHIHADAHGFYFINSETNRIHGYEAEDGNIHKATYSIGDTIASNAATFGRILNLKDPLKDPRFSQCTDRKFKLRPRFTLTVPVRIGSAIVGILHFVNKRKIIHRGSWPKTTTGTAIPGNSNEEGHEHDSRFAPPIMKEGVHFTVSHFLDLDETIASHFASIVSRMMKHIKTYKVSVEMKEKIKESIDEMEKYNQKNDFILNTVKYIYDSTDPEEVTQKIMHRAQQLVNADRCALFLVDRENRELYTTVAAGLSKGGVLRIPMGEGLAGHVANTGEVLNIPDAHLDKRFNPEIDKKTGYRTKALLCMPIRHHGVIIGVCQMLNKKNPSSKEGDVFDKSDETLFEAFAVFAGLALKNATMHKSMKDAQLLAELNLKKSETLQHQQKIIMEMATKISENLSTAKVISTIMNEARKLVDADRCSLFLVDKKKQELYSKMASGVDQLRIPMNRGVAGHVASTGEILNIPDAYEDPRFNKEIDLKTGYRTETILCMPIRHGEEIIGVAQMVNKSNGIFTNEDEVLFEAFSVFCGISLKNSVLYEDAIAARKQLKSLLEITLTLSGEQDVSTLLRSIMIRVQEFIDVDYMNSYAVDDENPSELYSFKATGEELRDNLRDGSQRAELLQNCAIGGEMIEVDELPAYRPVNNLLLIPIRSSVRKVAGVIELIDKRRDKFSKRDQDLVEAFATYFGSHLRSHENGENSTGQSSSGEGELSLEYYESKYAVTESRLKSSKDWNFEFWDCSHDDLIGLMASFFQDLGLINRFKLSKLRLYRFLRAISQRYNNVIYHNFQHAFMVTHSVYYLLSQLDRKSYLGDLQILGLLVAAVCHDVDHRGTNNMFQVNANTPLAMLYGTTSVMENHHCSVAVHVLTQEENDFLSALEKDDASIVWKTVINTILSTDLARYGQHMKKLDEVVASGYDASQLDHMQLACDTILAASDIANIAKRFDVAEKWARIVVSEMFAQGEVETKLGLKHAGPSSTKKIAELQTGFYNAFGAPLYNQITRLFPTFKFLSDQVENNRKNWISITQRSAAASPAE